MFEKNNNNWTKCGKNHWHTQLSPRVLRFMLLPNSYVIYAQSLNRRRATWKVFLMYNEETKNCYWSLSSKCTSARSNQNARTIRHLILSKTILIKTFSTYLLLANSLTDSQWKSGLTEPKIHKKTELSKGWSAFWSIQWMRRSSNNKMLITIFMFEFFFTFHNSKCFSVDPNDNHQ